MTETSIDLKLQSMNDDTIQCFFFTKNVESNFNYYENLCEQLNKLIEQLSKEYLWHRDEFRIYLPLEQNKDFPLHLASTTCFGDNIEDEWFIVYLLLEITKTFKDVIVFTQDNDGDFLLIEAADHLPFWANPENTQNRVFIYNGFIHIIPPPLAGMKSKLKLIDAIKLVTHQPDKTKAKIEIQDAILNRIGKYPEKIKENMHRTILNLPLDIATILSLKPSLIAPIVSAYCNHDMVDNNSYKIVKMDSAVKVEVKFTKCLYAMLVHSKPIKNSRINVTKKDNKSQLALKLACGYNMIMKKATNDIFASREFTKFLNSLKENGYFKDNIEGSKYYKELLEKAKDFFLRMECSISSHVSNIISQLLTTNIFAHQSKIVIQNSIANEFVEDDEDWLNIHPEQLNNLLNTRYGKQGKYKNDDVISPATITSELSNFLKQTSDFEGIESNTDKQDEDNIEFDSEEFVNSIQKMLNLVCHNAEISDLSDDFDEDQMENEIDDDLDKELAEKLHNIEDKLQDKNNVLENIVKSMKEEEGSSGPSSNILRSIGIHKTDLLDSDDDE